jgi:tetratricopeptide (TPR) repeat protein
MASAGELLNEARQAFDEGDLDSAANLFEQAHDADPKSPDGAIGMARVALVLGQAEDALEILDKVLKHFPKNAEALLYRGVVDESFGRLPAARGWYEKAVRQDPKLALAHYNFGRVLAQEKRWKDAVRELQFATRQQPSNVPFWYALGIAYQESGDPGHAIEAFSECIEINPLYAEGYATLADVLVMNGRDELAGKILENAVALFPESPVFYSKLAALAVRKKDFAGAVEWVKKQTEIEPENEETWLNLSVWAMLAGDLQTVEEGAKGAIQANPEGWRGYYHLGMLYKSIGLMDQALENGRIAVEKAPGEWEPKNNQGLALLETEDEANWREAVELLKQAVAECPVSEVHTPYYNLALGFWKIGDQEKSRLAAEASVAAGPAGNETVENARRFLGNFK